MNRIQREVVRDFVALHNDKIKAHLRSIGLINNNGTVPSAEKVQTELEQWFFHVIDNYSLELDIRTNGSDVEYTGNVNVHYEISKFNSYNRNPDVSIIFEFDANIWPNLLEEAVDVYVVPGCVDGNFSEGSREPAIYCDVLGDSRAESYRSLFIEDDLGAIADINGLNSPNTYDPATYPNATALQALVWKLIDQLHNDLRDSVRSYGDDLLDFEDSDGIPTDENGTPTYESLGKSHAWLEHNELTEWEFGESPRHGSTVTQT